MRISDWSSDVCSSDLLCPRQHGCRPGGRTAEHLAGRRDPAERYRHAVAAPDRGRPRPIGTAAGLIELLSGHAALRRSEYFRPDRGGLGSAPGCRHRPSNGTFAMTWTPSAIIDSESLVGPGPPISVVNPANEELYAEIDRKRAEQGKGVAVGWVVGGS